MDADTRLCYEGMTSRVREMMSTLDLTSFFSFLFFLKKKLITRNWVSLFHLCGQGSGQSLSQWCIGTAANTVTSEG